MITKTTNLDSAYTNLFDEIRAASNGNIDINNIEGFFGNIESIAQLDKKFLRLPLDEPMFEIDANSRKIAVPDTFKSNGVSVQGDHLAETVFFSIDRYFDYTDLSTTDITINWKMGTNYGKTKNFIMNKDILPGYIIFGWPINNDITVKSGSLTFAVEFRKEQNGQVVYDFNTLAANVNIKDGLVVSSEIEAVSLDNDILSILTNSSFGEGEAAVGNVNWVSGAGLVKNDSLIENEFIPAEFMSSIDLNTAINAGVPSSTPVDLFAEGFVDNSTVLRYSDSLGNNIAVFLKVPDFEEGAELPENQKYYVLENGSNPAAYNLASSEEIAAWSAEDETDRVDLYLKLAKLTVSEAGTYIVRGQGEKYNNDVKIGAGETVSTQAVVIPSAEKPSKINVVASDAPGVEEGFTFDESIENVIYLDGTNESVITANAEMNSFGALQFTWKKKLLNESNFSNVEEDEVAFKNENSDSLSVNQEGVYKVSVINFKNGTFAEPVESAEWTTSLLASRILGAVVKNGDVEVSGSRIDFNSAGSLAQRSITLTISDIAREADPRGTLAYEWRKGASFEDSVVVSTNNSFAISSEGNYIPVVKNIYNGSIFTKVLSEIFVNDIANDE